jgi:hypothetical protein
MAWVNARSGREDTRGEMLLMALLDFVCKVTRIPTK